MPRNHLCPEDYVRFIKEYVKERQGYTKGDIYEYCVANTKYMDDGDEKEIKHIINISLKQFGKAIQKRGEKYFTVASVEDVVVEDYPNVKMDLSESFINHIMSIEGRDMNFDFSDNIDNKKSEILEKPYPNLQVTDKTIENIKKHPQFYQNTPIRTYMGKIYKDGDFEKRSDEVLSKPLPDDIQEGKIKRFIRKIGQKFKK